MNERRLAGLSILLVGLVLHTGHGWADSWQHAVSTRLSTEFDTNPAMIPAYRDDGVWRFLFEPSYTLMGRVGASELKAGLALQIARSSNQTLSQDRENPSVFLDWRQRSDTGELGLTAKYDEVATRAAETDNVGVSFSDGRRASRTISASWSKALSERSTLSADGAYSDVSYTSGTFVDYVTRSGGMMFSYAWSERSTPFLRMSYSDTESAGNLPLTRFANAILGWDWKFSDYLEGTLQAGGSKISGARIGTQAAAGVKYTGQKTQLALNADRQISPSGLGGFVTADRVKGSWSYALSEHSNAGIDLEWRKSLSIATNNINTASGVWLQRDLNSFWRMRMNYLHSTREGGTAGVASSNILGITLIYSHTDF